MNKKFSDNLRKLRSDRGVTQSELAKAIGVSPSTVGMYETGEREPNFDTEEKIADYFNVSLDYLRGKAEKQSSGEAQNAVDAILEGKIHALNQPNQARLLAYYQALLDTQNADAEDIKKKLGDL